MSRHAKQPKPVVMYMHTLNGQPASLETGGRYGPYLFFASHRHVAKLASSLQQIRREQQACIAEAWREWTSFPPEFRGKRPSADDYGYVRVAVPASPAGRASALAGAR